MPPVASLTVAGIIITQRGKRADPGKFNDPVRLAPGPRFDGVSPD
ncbi:MAG: hypothetical protein WBW78_15420 [Terrimicrobiaceae bacterium]